jgi:hypothetical protein
MMVLFLPTTMLMNGGIHRNGLQEVEGNALTAQSRWHCNLNDFGNLRGQAEEQKEKTNDGSYTWS